MLHLALFLLLLVSEVCSQCQFFEQCKGQTLSGVIIICDGSNSCQEASLTASEDVRCQGAFSCTNLQYAYSVSQGLGLYSLYNSSFIPMQYIRNPMYMYGEKSCANCHIEIPTWYRLIAFDGYMSGFNADFTQGWGAFGRFGGAFALINATINITKDVNYQRFTGYYALYNTDIYCAGGVIECYGSSCSGAKNLYKSGNCRAKCTGSLKNSICPNGYDDPLLEIIKPENLLYNNYDLVSSGLDISTMENSIDIYLSSHTEFFSCSTWCGTSITLNTNKTIICAGAGSCRHSSLTTSSRFKNVSIRCDGGYSSEYPCSYSNLLVTGSSPNGNVFCSGANSCYFSTIHFETPANVYCTGGSSCTGTTVTNAKHILLGGERSGIAARFENIHGDFYLLGADAALNTRAGGTRTDIINVSGTVYVLNWRSGASVNNATQILGAGWWSMVASEIRNVPKVYLIGDFMFAWGVLHGSETTDTEFTCRGACCGCFATFYGVSDIFIEDRHPLWAATVEGFVNFHIKYSEYGYPYNVTIDPQFYGLTISTSNYRGNSNKYFTLEGNPDPDDVIPYDITCDEDDSLYIRCLNETSCAKMQLTCNGCCFLDCHVGFFCPNITIGSNGQLLDYDDTKNPSSITTAPTYQPSHGPTITPSLDPSNNPTKNPSIVTSSPSSTPSEEPSKPPSVAPSNTPTQKPTTSPSAGPTKSPSDDPTTIPTSSTSMPSTTPSFYPTKQPTDQPTTDEPTTADPTTAQPTLEESCTLYPGLRYGGSKIGNTRFGIPNADTCCNLCHDEPECLYFRHRASNQRCILLRSLGNIRNNNNWISGEKDVGGAERNIVNKDEYYIL